MPTPDFITELRTMVGHHLLWLPGVSGVVTDEAGRVLLGRRSDDGRWSIPSGILEPGEQPADGIVREIAEETGVSVRVGRLVQVGSEAPVTYANGDVCQFLDLLYECRYVSGEARVADDESLEVAWFDPVALPAMTASQLAKIERVLGPVGG